jgi:hypothetical protein
VSEEPPVVPSAPTTLARSVFKLVQLFFKLPDGIDKVKQAPTFGWGDATAEAITTGKEMAKIHLDAKEKEDADNDKKALASDVSDIKGNVGTVRTDVGAIKTKVDTINTNVGTINTNVGNLGPVVGNINTNIGTIMSNTQPQTS